jgi:hypothetical protein
MIGNLGIGARRRQPNAADSKESDMLPNFFIVGAAKAGTTSLYHYLDQHPQVYMSPIKEPCYFASEVRPENFDTEFRQQAQRGVRDTQEYIHGPMTEKRFGGMVTEWEDYVNLFRNVKEESAIGEASVSYLWSKTAAANMQSRIPEAKIVIVLRNPADRAFSEYHHVLTEGRTRFSFRDYIQVALRSKSEKLRTPYNFLECGLYYEQVKRYLDLFPRYNIRIYFYEDYVAKFPQLWRDVLSFLQVNSSFSPDTALKHLEPRVPRLMLATYVLKKYGVWPRLTRLSSKALRPILLNLAFRRRSNVIMNLKDRQYLISYYQEDIRKLSALVNRDLSAWLA